MKNEEKLANAINSLLKSRPKAVITEVDSEGAITFTEAGKAMYVLIDWHDGEIDGPWPVWTVDDYDQPNDQPIVGPGSDVWP